MGQGGAKFGYLVRDSSMRKLGLAETHQHAKCSAAAAGRSRMRNKQRLHICTTCH
jgi:hypothetical protein